jgi:hypothetical protein
MDTIKGTVLEIANDYENVFHIIIEAQIPKGVVFVDFDQKKLGKDPKISTWVPQPNGAFRLTATTIGEPTVTVEESLPIQVFYHGEVVLKDAKPSL